MSSTPFRSLKAFGSSIRTGWLFVGLILALIVLCEAGLRLALTARDRLLERQTAHRMVEVRAGVDAYQGADWVREYIRELDASYRFTWHSYVYWRRSPYQGRYIEVGRDGLRATWNPPPGDVPGDPPPVRVFTFGASTLWGYGVRDDYTVASYLSKLLHARGYRAEVTNYGEAAYVSTQGVITLLRCIHRGEIPDIVLFYDGINDTFSSYQNNQSGIPQNEKLRREEFNLTDNQWKQFRLLLAHNFWGVRRLVTGLRRRITNTGPDTWRQTHPLSDELARQTVRVYESNLATIESLGRRYGFEPLFYWQPNIFSKQHRSPDEQTTFEHFADLGEWFDKVYQRVRRSEALDGNPRFHDISGIFNDPETPETPYYIDATHLSEPGNRLIAAAMVDDVIALIERRRATAAEQAAR